MPDTGREKSVRLQLPQDENESKTDVDPSQLDTVRSKSSLRTTPKSFTPQYLSTGTAQSEESPNNNNNFTFDQFLQTLQSSDEPPTKSGDEDSLGYDRKSDSFDENKSGALVSKSGVFSESLLKSEERTLKSVSGLNDVFENAEGKEDAKEYDGPRTSSNYISFPYGFQQKCGYEHNKKLTDLVDGEFFTI